MCELFFYSLIISVVIRETLLLIELVIHMLDYVWISIV